MAPAVSSGKVREFKGRLGIAEHEVPITFKAHLNDTGEMEIGLEEIPLTNDTQFIMHAWHRPDGRITYFRLNGSAEGDVTFATETLFFNSIGPHSSSTRGSYFVLDAHCEDARLEQPSAKPSNGTALILLLRGFRCFPSVRATSPLGDFLAQGDVNNDEIQQLSGYIQIHVREVPPDLAKWRADALRVLDHVRRVMSFASGAILSDPVLNFVNDARAETNFRHRTAQAAPHAPNFHPVGSDAIFEVAVRSFFQPPYAAENLWMALEWLSMEATYNEVRLVNAMTALENLVSSNTRDVARTLDDDLFDQLRKLVRATIKQFLESNVPQEARSKLLEEFTPKLNELQRRSLKRRLDILLERWSIPTLGITNKMIRDAFSARNDIIHEGRYYIEGEVRPELWEHFCVVRELVVRIMFRALGFEGRYISHLGGYHEATFPPVKIACNPA